MNTNLGLVGKKLGNTQIFNDDGTVTRVTAIQVGPCIVLAKRTEEKDGYTALVLGLGTKREKLVAKPQAGFFKKLGQPVNRTIKELRVSPELSAKFEVGQVLKPSEVFTVGQKVDVSGKTRGRGFTGVMARWNFSGFPMTHGTHEYRRHGGSIGCRKWPGRVIKGRRMPGHMGDERVTTQNLAVAEVRETDNLLLVKGSVPGAKNGYLLVRPAVKSNPTP